MKKLLLLSIVFVITLTVKGQSGTYLYSLFTSSSYYVNSANATIPNSRLYVYPAIDTTASAWNSLVQRIYKFPSALAYNCLDSIKIKQTFTFDDSMNAVFNYYYSLNPLSAYRQTNPCQFLIFDLGGIRDTSYNTFTPKSGPVATKDTEICFFIIPGSNNNQTSEIIKGVGYHNTNCDVVSRLKKHGDVYVYTKPNEDYRAIRITANINKKMQTDLYPNDSYLNNYLNINDRKDGINVLIQCVATIKELKRKYKRVMVLGCSQGGYLSLLTSLESEVDGSIVSSGYSIKLDDNILQFGNMLAKYSLFSQFYSKDSIKSKIANQKTNFFFTWPYFDSQIYQDENIYHYTQNYFSNPPSLSKVEYYYTYFNHSFPGCAALDSMINKIKFKAKPLFLDTLNSCFQDSISRHIEFLGTPPFTYSLFKNNQFLQSITISTKHDTLTFFENGQYQIKNIIDGNGVQGLWSEKFTFKKEKPTYFKIDSSSFNCNNLSRTIHFSMKGEKPFQISIYRNGGLVNNINTNDTIYHLNVINGFYQLNFNDHSNCAILKDSILINEANPLAEIQSLNYNCSANNTELKLKLEGKSPFVLNYNLNGISSLLNLQNDTVLLLNNGNYYFEKVIDANQCNLNIDTLFDINTSNLQYNIVGPNYNCDSNKAKIDFHLQGNAPWKLYYRRNGQSKMFQTSNADFSLYFNNSILYFDSIKDATCLKIIAPNDSIKINYNAISINPFVSTYVCDSAKVNLKSSIQGNLPCILNYTKDGLSQQQLITSNNYNELLTNGIYNFISLSDYTNCVLPINEVHNFNYQILDYSISEKSFFCDSNKAKIDFHVQGNAPWTLYYRKNGQSKVFQTSSTDFSLYFDNSVLYFDSIRDVTCTKIISPTDSIKIAYNSLNMNPILPSYICDSSKVSLNFNVQGNFPITLKYSENGIIQQSTISSANTQYYFYDGLYNFISLTDSTNCVHYMNQAFNFNYNNLSFQVSNPEFICDSNKTKISFELEGNPPFKIFYRKNNIPFSISSNVKSFEKYFVNGQYVFDSIKDATCSKLINPTVSYYINNSVLGTVISPPIYDCDSNKVKVNFDFQGNAPWKVHYLKLGVPTSHFEVNFNSNQGEIYFEQGDFLIDSITDMTNCAILPNTYVNNNFNILGIQKINSVYNCDSAKVQIDYLLAGDAPFTIKYLNIQTNQLVTKFTTANTFSLYLGNGQYVIQSITDFKCTKIINDTISNVIPQLVSTLSNSAISCDTNKTYLILNTISGVPPFTYDYIWDTQSISYSTNNYIDTIYLNNGNYYFKTITDSLGCVINYNHALTANYNPFFFSGLETNYNCEKDSTLITLAVQNINDIYLKYSKNGGNSTILTLPFSNNKFYIGNGFYEWISLSDSAGCERLLGLESNINNVPVKYNKDSIIYDCETKESRLAVNLEGTSPWTFVFIKENKLYQIDVDSSFSTIPLMAGNYNFVKLIDSNSCEIAINNEFQVHSFLQSPIVITNDEQNRLVATEVPFNYAWFKNETLVNNENDNIIYPHGSGSYYAQVIDSAGCFYNSNLINLEFESGFSLYPNPANDLIYLIYNQAKNDSWNYSIFDMTGRKVLTGFGKPYSTTVSISGLAKGIYNIIVEDLESNDTQKQILRFVKE